MSLETIIFWGITVIYILLVLIMTNLASLYEASNLTKPDSKDQNNDLIAGIMLAISGLAYGALIVEVWL